MGALLGRHVVTIHRTPRGHTPNYDVAKTTVIFARILEVRGAEIVYLENTQIKRSKIPLPPEFVQI